MIDKSAARKAAFVRRKAAHEGAVAASGYLSEILAGYRGVPIAGYSPIRTEINPLPALAEAAAHGPVGMPVIIAEAQPLKFRLWEPDCAMVPGAFGALIPETGAWMIPEIVIVPLVAFDRQGGRLGYGGGFYDRTLEQLRSVQSTMAIGFAYAAQEDKSLTLEPTDQPLDLIVTEQGVITPAQK